jgi:serine/threonine-protein kinase
MNMREQFERALRVTLLIFVLAAAGFLSAVTAIRIAIRGRVVAMPNLVGLSASAAQRALSTRGLQLRVADRVYSSLPVNSVVRQSPPPGEQVKVAQDAHVVLSLGPQTASVPPIEGVSMRAARIALLQAGLQLGEVSAIYMPGSEPDTVLRQSPPPGANAASPHVDLLVAAGDRPVSYVMPGVVGLQQPEAEHVLVAAGLHVTKVTRLSDTGSAKGTVVGQTPARGQRIAGDAPVELGIAN